jgi:hypothetical protein
MKHQAIINARIRKIENITTASLNIPVMGTSRIAHMGFSTHRSTHLEIHVIMDKILPGIFNFPGFVRHGWTWVKNLKAMASVLALSSRFQQVIALLLALPSATAGLSAHGVRNRPPRGHGVNTCDITGICFVGRGFDVEFCLYALVSSFRNLERALLQAERLRNGLLNRAVRYRSREVAHRRHYGTPSARTSKGNQGANFELV